MDSKSSEKKQEIIKLIDEIVEILKRILYNFSNNKISRGENGMIFFSYWKTIYGNINTFRRRKISLKVKLNNNKDANHKLRRFNPRQHYL